ncbi:adenylate/guanylate cyclase domain-containing protein [Alicyclobacillus mengziensis]|uniref:Adenylate/guanylate cyclase domain-containing protein n=1 Tax=Alicyclobacillus mengziensis TaxID=2931921 RepID=A0A9X7W2K8_9BACL|nr:adenylate/guanylate cyclase domain-containing protein [Alicyclobacillus mengziensis]QSO49184.1 adenylate/guanylate cyclase domain-containing protein [Alicyclobacillus mengziensis]
MLQRYSYYTGQPLNKSIYTTDSIDTKDVGEIPLGKYIELDLVTLCVDIRASTIRSAKESLTDSISMLNVFFSTVARVLRDSDAIIDKYPGDGVMAHFAMKRYGAERAVKAACIIKRLVEEHINEKLQEQSLKTIKCGVSIDAPGSGTALACVGIEEHREIIAVGNSVNVAAKMEKAAKNRVVIGNDVYRRLPGHLSRHCSPVDIGIVYDSTGEPYPGYEVDWLAVTESR